MTIFNFCGRLTKEPPRKWRFFCAFKTESKIITPSSPPPCALVWKAVWPSYKSMRRVDTLPDARAESGMTGKSMDNSGFVSENSDSGNVLFYVFLAIGLMAALTYAFVKDSRENYSAQSSVRIAEELFSQVNLIRSAVQQCAMEFPQGGGDIAPLATPDGVITAADNANNPYPIDPDTDLIT
ncbi:MAG: hypothetical protein KAI76_02845, partial [Alphaproteobacteria bacterium]|nr:hypothetical protein [Alphaproteobacteria bacterium]